MGQENPNCPGRSSDLSSAQHAQDLDLPIINPIDLTQAAQTADLIDNVYAQSGFNARRLAEAAHLYSRMLKDDTTVCLTLAGAMTPIGMSGVVNSLIRAGFIDCIISTGANLYHDMHRPFSQPMMQGHFAVDDNDLADTGIARIYDVFIEDEDTLMATDRVILETVEGIEHGEPLSTADLHHALGRGIAKVADRPDWSILVTAAEHDVPVYTSSPGDSSIAMNLTVPHMFGKPVQLDPLQDIIETTAVVRSAKTNGVIVVGGGSPKNFYFQTQPTLHQIFMDTSVGGHDYVIQLTTDAPHWGGLSGATIAEARSWGKVQDAHVNHTIVYSCASLTLPLLAQYVLARNEPKKSKRLFKEMPKMVRDFKESARANPRLRESLKDLVRHYPGLTDESGA
jgi:deoxyhypusine synthase